MGSIFLLRCCMRDLQKSRLSVNSKLEVLVNC